MRASLIIVTVLFAITLAMGLAAPPEVGRAQLEGLGEIIAPVIERGLLAILALIAVNNILTTFFFMLLGVIAGVPPLVFVAVNGYVIGAVASTQAAEVGAAAVVASLAPHGIIEIPAALLAAGLGLRVGFEVLRRLTGRVSAVRHWLRTAVRTYFRWVFPSLLVAALIEVFVTPLIITAVLNGAEAG